MGDVNHCVVVTLVAFASYFGWVWVQRSWGTPSRYVIDPLDKCGSTDTLRYLPIAPLVCVLIVLAAFAAHCHAVVLMSFIIAFTGWCCAQRFWTVRSRDVSGARGNGAWPMESERIYVSLAPVACALIVLAAFYASGQGRELLAIHQSVGVVGLPGFDVPTTLSLLTVFVTLLIFPFVQSLTVWEWFKPSAIWAAVESARGRCALAILLASLFPALVVSGAIAAREGTGIVAVFGSGFLSFVCAALVGIGLLLALLLVPLMKLALEISFDWLGGVLKPSVGHTPVLFSWLKRVAEGVANPFLQPLIFTRRLISLGFALVLLLSPAIVVLLLAIDFPPSKLLFNPIVVVNVWVAWSLIVFKIDGWCLLRWKWSPVAGWLAAAMVLGLTDANDNHGVARSDLGNVAQASPAREPFSSWLTTRGWSPDSNSPLPVYLVAAQGGGIYAANHTAQFLAALQDEAPQFARHLLGISAVSGGSLGAGVFTALVQERERTSDEQDWFKTHADRILGRDFLTNLAAATVFTDLPARALPCKESFCPGEKLNRARAFEVAVEDFWKDEFAAKDETSADSSTCREEAQAGCWDNPWRQALATSWSATRDVPMLWLNTTEVETGETVVLRSGASVYEGEGSIRWYPKSSEPLRMSTAVGISAAFPVLAPASWYTRTDKNAATGADAHTKRRLVDGGYFDNSGVLTALAIRRQICKRYSCVGSVDASKSVPPANGQLRVVILVLALDSSVVRGNNAAGALGELLSVFRAFGNARGARARVAIQEANITIDGAACFGPSNCLHEGDVRVSTLSTPKSLPLGWQLAPNTRCAIQWSIGIDVDCGESFRALRGSDLPAQFRQKNECVLASVLDDLGVDGPYRCRETLIKTTDGF